MFAAFCKDLRLILRDRWLVALSMVVPLAVISVIAAALLTRDGAPRLSVVVVDEDGGAVARDLVRILAEHATVVELPREAGMRVVRELHQAPAAIVLPAQLSENFRRGRPSELPLLTDPAQETGLRALKVLLLLLEKRAAALADPFAEQLLVLREHNLTGNRATVTPFELNLPGFTILFVLIAVIFSTALALHDERDWGTLPRLMVAPSGLTAVLLGNLAARWLFGLLQMLVMLLWSHLVFSVSLGSTPVAVVVLSAAIVAATVATGVLTAAVTRTREQVLPLALALVIVLSGLGGLWWPQSMAPAWMQAVAPAVYTTWAMHGMNDLVLRDRPLLAVLRPAGAMALYAALAIALGLRLFRARQGWR